MNKHIITDNFTFFFKGEFSQWFPSEFSYGGVDFPTAEHFTMYMKAELFNDPKIARKIAAEPNPRYAKELGREVRGFSQARWDMYKYAIVQMGNYLKFNYHKELLEKLLATGETLLVEASPVDTVWGIGLGMEEDIEKLKNKSNWRGHNLLGRVLTDVREVLRFRTQNKNRLCI